MDFSLPVRYPLAANMNQYQAQDSQSDSFPLTRILGKLEPIQADDERKAGRQSITGPKLLETFILLLSLGVVVVVVVPCSKFRKIAKIPL